MRIYIDNKFYNIIGEVLSWYISTNSDEFYTDKITHTSEILSNLEAIKHYHEQSYNEDISLIKFEINNKYIYYLLQAIDDAIIPDSNINIKELNELKQYLNSININ